MGAKVSFDETTKIITVTVAPVGGEILLDVKTDLYSDGKEDWVLNENLRKFRFPIESVGGNPLPGAQELGATFFLAADWKIRPYEASHKIIIDGNLYSEDGSDPFLDTLGPYTVRIIQKVSTIVTATVSGSGVTGQDKIDIADAVWADSDGVLVSDYLNFIRDIEGGKWQLTTTQMIFYKDDNITEVARFNITKDIDGNPIMRERV